MRNAVNVSSSSSEPDMRQIRDPQLVYAGQHQGARQVGINPATVVCLLTGYLIFGASPDNI
jgi:hypothetical protein